MNATETKPINYPKLKAAYEVIIETLSDQLPEIKDLKVYVVKNYATDCPEEIYDCLKCARICLAPEMEYEEPWYSTLKKMAKDMLSKVDALKGKSPEEVSEIVQKAIDNCTGHHCLRCGTRFENVEDTKDEFCEKCVYPLSESTQITRERV